MTAPKILTAEEIAALIGQDARQTDKIILTAVNDLSAAFLDFRYKDFPDHALAEEALNKKIMGVLEEVGDKELARKRMEYIDTLIARNKDRSEMYRHVSRAGAWFVLAAFLVFLGKSLWLGIVDAVGQTYYHGGKP